MAGGLQHKNKRNKSFNLIKNVQQHCTLRCISINNVYKPFDAFQKLPFYIDVLKLS